MSPAVDHLLRTMAAVPIGSRVLDLECDDGGHVVPLCRLGFDLWACDRHERHVEATRRRLREAGPDAAADRRVRHLSPDALDFPDDAFDWVVATGLLHRPPAGPDHDAALAEVRRVLVPGGWVHVVAPARPEPSGDGAPHPSPPRFAPDTLDALWHGAGFGTAEPPVRADYLGEALLYALYRNVDRDTAP